MDPERLKIVVFGSFHAGKSTFIQSVDPDSRHVDTGRGEGSTTVALDYGRVNLESCQVHLYGTPGQERFGFAREIIMQGMDAALLMIDCTCAVDSLTKCIHQDLTASRVPLGLLLNKCDVAESCPSMVRKELPGDTHVYEISAKDPASAREALNRFVRDITPIRPRDG